MSFNQFPLEIKYIIFDYFISEDLSLNDHKKLVYFYMFYSDLLDCLFFKNNFKFDSRILSNNKIPFKFVYRYYPFEEKAWKNLKFSEKQITKLFNKGKIARKNEKGGIKDLLVYTVMYQTLSENFIEKWYSFSNNPFWEIICQNQELSAAINV